MNQTDRFPLFLTPEHPCAYLPDREARTLFLDPNVGLTPPLYQGLLELGFRRSGGHVYRPACGACHDCIPVRVPVAEFRPARTQRRCWQKSADALTVTPRPPVFDPGHFDLYRRYTACRHPDGGMADADEERYLDFLGCPWGDTRFFEFRLHGELLAVAVTDVLPDGLSAVYTFFDPERERLSPGVLAVLWQIREAQARGLPWLYLGYWIRDSEKMSYKDRYRPIEAWDGRGWRRFGPGESLTLEFA